MAPVIELPELPEVSYNVEIAELLMFLVGLEVL